MYGFLILVQLFVCFLLITVVLMQSSKGGGLAGTFGGGSVGMVFGVRRTSDFLIRATQVLATIFLLLSLVINIFFLPRVSTEESVIRKGGATQQSAPIPQLPTQTPPATPPAGQ
jgi:preprotein translocase subunit SecG